MAAETPFLAAISKSILFGEPARMSSPRRRSWIMHRHSSLARFIGLYAALYAGFGVMSPFLPDFLHQRGLSAAEIGSVMAFATAVRLVAGPLAGRIADR